MTSPTRETLAALVEEAQKKSDAASEVAWRYRGYAYQARARRVQNALIRARSALAKFDGKKI